MDLDGHLSHLYVRTWSTMLALWIFIQADHQSLLWPANDSFIVPYTDYTVVPIYGVYIYSSMLLRMKTWSNFVAACNLRHIVAEEWIGCIQDPVLLCCAKVLRTQIWTAAWKLPWQVSRGRWRIVSRCFALKGGYVSHCFPWAMCCLCMDICVFPWTCHEWFSLPASS